MIWLDTTEPESVSAFARRGEGETVIVLQNWTDREITCKVSFAAPKDSVPSYIVAEDVDRDVKGTVSPVPLHVRNARETGYRTFTLGPWGCWISAVQ